jgi:hypothetical protein
MTKATGSMVRNWRGMPVAMLLWLAPAMLSKAEAADGKVYTQVPTVAPSINPGQTEPETGTNAEDPPPTGNPLPQWICEEPGVGSRV